MYTINDNSEAIYAREEIMAILSVLKKVTSTSFIIFATII